VLAALQDCCSGEMVVDVCLAPERSADKRSCPSRGMTGRKADRSSHKRCFARGMCLGTEDLLNMLAIYVFIPGAFVSQWLGALMRRGQKE
jgi:hypothetical protein